jgi:hypothetical protein
MHASAIAIECRMLSILIPKSKTSLSLYYPREIDHSSLILYPLNIPSICASRNRSSNDPIIGMHTPFPREIIEDLQSIL